MKNKKILGIVMVLLLILVSFGFQRVDAKEKKTSAPVIKKIQAIENGVKVTFDKPQKVYRYELHYKKEGEKEFQICTASGTEIYGDAKSTCIFTGLDIGKYIIKVRSVNSGEKGSKFTETKTVSVSKEISDIIIDTENFPDEKVRSFIQRYDLDSDGILSGIENSKILGIGMLGGAGEINNWKGMDKLAYLEVIELEGSANNNSIIQNFNLKNNTELRYLRLSYVSVDKLELENNVELRYVKLSKNNLEKLNLKENVNLVELSCSDNLIKVLDLRKNKELRGLHISNCNIKKINLKKNKKLKEVSCDCKLLDVSNNISLESLKCRSLKSEDLTKHIYLSRLNCNNQDMVKRKVKISKESFPDKKFRNYIKDTYDLDKDGYLNTMEIVSVTDMNLDNMGLLDLSGIECFSGNLERLSCRNNDFEWISVYEFPCLVMLDCSENSKLKNINCWDCSIDTLNARNCKELNSLDCYNNSIQNLDVSGVKPEYSSLTLRARNNKLVQVDLSKCESGLVFLEGNDIQSVLVADEQSALKIIGVDKSKIFVVEE